MRKKTIAIQILMLLTLIAFWFSMLFYFAGIVPTEIKSFTVDSDGTLAVCVTGRVVFCTTPGEEESKRLPGVIDTDHAIVLTQHTVTIYGSHSSWATYDRQTWQLKSSGTGSPITTLSDPVPYKDSVFLYRSVWGRGQICEKTADGREIVWYRVPLGGFLFRIFLYVIGACFAVMIPLLLIHIVRNYNIEVDLKHFVTRCTPKTASKEANAK